MNNLIWYKCLGSSRRQTAQPCQRILGYFSYGRQSASCQLRKVFDRSQGMAAWCSDGRAEGIPTPCEAHTTPMSLRPFSSNSPSSIASDWATYVEVHISLNQTGRIVSADNLQNCLLGRFLKLSSDDEFIQNLWHAVSSVSPGLTSYIQHKPSGS